MTERIIEKNHFLLHRVREIPEMQGKLWEMEHPKSGARLAWLQRQEENMTDRAGLLYAAMEPGNRELFLSARLQNKLAALCQGLRQAFPEIQNAKRPWEQYLWRQ